MAMKLYAAKNGNKFLTVSSQPGEVTEELIRSNVQRMIEMEDGDEDWTRLWKKTALEFEENYDRLCQLAHLHSELEEVEDTLGLQWELETMPWSEFLESEIPVWEMD